MTEPTVPDAADAQADAQAEAHADAQADAQAAPMRQQGPSAPPSRHWPRPALTALVAVLVLMVAGGLITVLVVALVRPGIDTADRGLSADDRALLKTRLAGIDVTVDRLVLEADTLARSGREVLTRSRALDTDGADAAIVTGSQASAAIALLGEDLSRQREALTAGIEASRLDSADQARMASVDLALQAATQLPVAWASVVAVATDPLDLVRSIEAHDRRVAEATATARADDLPGAISAIEEARRLLLPARAVRNGADDAGKDVSTLDDLLARLDTYDDALGRLYALLVASDGAVTDQVRTAYDEVRAAQASLPRDQDALMVIVADLAGPAVTAALVEIETQRGLLADAVAARSDTDAG